MKNRDKIIKYAISLMIILLPMIDIIRTTYLKDVELFGLSIIELVNILLISIAFVVTLIKLRGNIRYKKLSFIYVILLIIYIILHCINILEFDKNIYIHANQNSFVEIYYIFRVYILPLMLFFTVISNKDIFNKSYLNKCIIYLVSFNSLSIILFNLFRFSYSSYGTGVTEYLINRSSFIDVFKYNGNYKDLLTCGLFVSANQISIILVMLLPLNIHNFYNKKNIISMFLVIIQCISMIIVGTKTAAYGEIIILVGCLCMYLFFLLIKREEFNKNYFIKYLIVLIIVSFVLYVSPFRYLRESERNYDYNSNTTLEEKDYAYGALEKEMDTSSLIDLLTSYDNVFKINKAFYDMYPLENDLSFWVDVAKRDRVINNDYRVMKNTIMKRIIERNNNKYDKYLGIGYTVYFQDMEVDYVYQYYLFGLIGLVLFIGIYIFIYISNMYKCLKKNNFIYENTLLLVGAFFGLVLCYFSGHLFGWVSPMIILSMSLAVSRQYLSYDK